MQNNFWNDSDGFSIKDLFGIVFGSLFVLLSLIAVIFPSRLPTIISLMQTLSPILLLLLGGYALTEGANSILNNFNKKEK